MFKYTLAATLDEMDREGITVAECPLRSMRCLSLQNGRIVGINTARFDSSAEVRTALIHEDGHFASGAFYLPYSPYQLKAQAEYRADKAAVLKHIPYSELAARLENRLYGCDTCQEVCPWNRFACPTEVEAFRPTPALLSFRKEDLKVFSREEYNRIFAKSAVKRAKYEGLIRNIHNLKD